MDSLQVHEHAKCWLGCLSRPPRGLRFESRVFRFVGPVEPFDGPSSGFVCWDEVIPRPSLGENQFGGPKCRMLEHSVLLNPKKTRVFV